jgi:hypothetical protein
MSLDEYEYEPTGSGPGPMEYDSAIEYEGPRSIVLAE